jgi:hypothetical protein
MKNTTLIARWSNENGNSVFAYAPMPESQALIVEDLTALVSACCGDNQAAMQDVQDGTPEFLTIRTIRHIEALEKLVVNVYQLIKSHTAPASLQEPWDRFLSSAAGIHPMIPQELPTDIT